MAWGHPRAWEYTPGQIAAFYRLARARRRRERSDDARALRLAMWGTVDELKTLD
jgi:hypothetical protein